MIIDEPEKRKEAFSRLVNESIIPTFRRNKFYGRKPNFAKELGTSCACVTFFDMGRAKGGITFNFSFYIPDMERDFFQRISIPKPQFRDCHTNTFMISDILQHQYRIYLMGVEYFVSGELFNGNYLRAWTQVINSDWGNGRRFPFGDDVLEKSRQEGLAFLERYSPADIDRLKNQLEYDLNDVVIPFFDKIKTDDDLFDAFSELVSFNCLERQADIALLTYYLKDKAEGRNLMRAYVEHSPDGGFTPRFQEFLGRSST